jgi:hypothetical protein
LCGAFLYDGASILWQNRSPVIERIAEERMPMVSKYAFLSLPVLFILSSVCLSQSALAHDLVGVWTGQGVWQKADDVASIDIDSAMQVSMDSKSIAIKECWKYNDPDEGPKQQCIDSHYDIVDEKIYTEGRPIGDVFSDHIVIFQSGAQASEQMVLELNETQNKMRYRYSYSNMDGDAERRTVTYQRVQSQPQPLQ